MTNLSEKIHTAIALLKDKKFEFLNPSAQKLFGWDLAELNKNILNLDRLSHGLVDFGKLLNEILIGKYEEKLGPGKFQRFELSLEGQYYNLYLSKPSNNEYLLEFSPIVYQDMKQSTHELKRPIQNIKTLTETLIMGAKNDPIKCSEYLTKLNYEADRLGSLVNDMLSLSYILNGVVELKKIEINLKHLTEKIFESLNTKAGAQNIELINECTDSLIVFADQKLFEHLLSNLIDNAIKYNKTNGKVVVCTSAKSISVKDTGLGISEEDQGKIFEQFYRIKDRIHIQGNGLGLNIVKGIVELHGWKIELKSSFGQGSEFVIIM